MDKAILRKVNQQFSIEASIKMIKNVDMEK
jgi:hypothetical protein